MPIHVELVTQERKVFEEKEADIILIPAVEGEMGVLPGHAPVLTTLNFGELIVRKGNAEERFAVYGGVVDVRPDKVVVLADLAESSYGIDLEKANAARERAQALVKEGVSEMNREATLSLRRAELQLRVVRKIKERTGALRIVAQPEE